MQVIWSQTAITTLIEIRAFIGEHNPMAAQQMVARLLEAGNALETFPNRGRPVGVPNVREMVVSGTPYLLVYRIEGERVEVLSVWHGAQDRASDD